MKGDHWKPSSSCCQQISYIKIFSQSFWQVRLSISREITVIWNVKFFQFFTKKILVMFLNKTWFKGALSKTGGWISPLEFRYAEDKNSQNSFQLSVGSCKCFERMQLQNHLKEEMTLQPGSTGLAAELALLCTQCQQMVHKLWKSSCQRGCLAP